MGCNCKSKINKKYTDGKDDGRENRTATGVFFHKILNVFSFHGSTFEYKELTVTVDSVEDQRINTVSIRYQEAKEKDE